MKFIFPYSTTDSVFLYQPWKTLVFFYIKAKKKKPVNSGDTIPCKFTIIENFLEQFLKHQSAIIQYISSLFGHISDITEETSPLVFVSL